MELCVTSEISSRALDGEAIPFAEGAALAARAGFSQMDYSFSAAALLADGWEQAALERQRQAQDAGIALRYAHLPFDYPRDPGKWPDFFEASCRAMELACRFGVECAAVHPCTAMTSGYDPAAAREKALAFLAPYCEYAKQGGLVLALENMRGAGKSSPLVRYATKVDEVWDLAEALDIGVCWDTGHGHISGQAQEPSIKRIAPRLKMLHVNDNFAEDDVHLAPFLGTVDWQGVTAALRAVGFTGAINLEVNANKRPRALRETYAAYMAQAARLLREQAEKKA